MLKSVIAVVGTSLLVAACGSGDQPDANVGGSEQGLSFEDYESTVPREIGTRAYLVEGDIPIWSREELKAYFGSLQGQRVPAREEPAAHEGASELGSTQAPLVVNTASGADTKWSPSQQNSLTYCVSNAFGGRKAAVVSAMQAAASAWSAAANVTMIYASGQDGSCTAGNNNVVFDVQPTSGQSYIARSFFPNTGRSGREVLIDSSAFSLSAPLTLTGVLRHELGHTLGFRHEHTAGATSCYEDQNWRALTSYDSASVMHYPQCGGTGDSSLNLTSRDKNGAACLYGAAPGFAPDCTYHGVAYQAHVANIGWMPTVKSGDIAGTVGQSRSSQAFTIQMQNTPGIGICYQAHVAGIGWLEEVCDGAVAGTVGQSRGLQAIRIRLTGAPAGCSVLYQAHVADIGWQGAVADNAVAGTTGQSRDIQGLKVWTSGNCGF